MLKKLFIVPWAGPFPDWMVQYFENIEHLKKHGYDWLILNDLDDFQERVKRSLEIDITIEEGSRKIHDFRTAFGHMYRDRLAGYDYWGFTDPDCVYGDIPAFMSDDELSELDIWSNHHNYICGPWTLFKNEPRINQLFLDFDGWYSLMADSSNPNPGRWTEQGYSEMIDALHNDNVLNRKYTFWQGKDPNVWTNLKMNGDKLFDGDDEIMMFHFNRGKVWPL